MNPVRNNLSIFSAMNKEIPNKNNGAVEKVYYGNL